MATDPKILSLIDDYCYYIAEAVKAAGMLPDKSQSGIQVDLNHSIVTEINAEVKAAKLPKKPSDSKFYHDIFIHSVAQFIKARRINSDGQNDKLVDKIRLLTENCVGEVDGVLKIQNAGPLHQLGRAVCVALEHNLGAEKFGENDYPAMVEAIVGKCKEIGRTSFDDSEIQQRIQEEVHDMLVELVMQKGLETARIDANDFVRSMLLFDGESLDEAFSDGVLREKMREAVESLMPQDASRHFTEEGGIALPKDDYIALLADEIKEMLNKTRLSLDATNKLQLEYATEIAKIMPNYKTEREFIANNGISQATAALQEFCEQDIAPDLKSALQSESTFNDVVRAVMQAHKEWDKLNGLQGPDMDFK